eukprot:TRINITY_DN4534_c0_g1_i1.p1 TRINITY_DN4534_c0_g1~~TRINITY_DN4534_c0_g1_i1.p1  ORF type:complete len:682 (+),score=123.67 TRINITY_DN4534_c0_g1_i1:113-2158(+)
MLWLLVLLHMRLTSCVLFSEILAHTDPPEVDWVELYNEESVSVDISGWALRTEGGKYSFPSGTILQPYQYFVTEITLEEQGFRLSSYGETVSLLNKNGKKVETVEFPTSPNGVSMGRMESSNGKVEWPLTQYKTKGYVNSAPLVPLVVINSLYFPHGSVKFLKMKSLSPTFLPLFDITRPENVWRITVGSSGKFFAFPQKTILRPLEEIYVISSDDITAFREENDLPPEVQVFGPFDGLKKSKRLVLQSPDKQDELFTPYLVHDIVNTDSDWPNSTEVPIIRISDLSWGNEPRNWRQLTDPFPPSCPCPNLDKCTVSTCIGGSCYFRLACHGDEAFSTCFPKTEVCHTLPNSSNTVPYVPPSSVPDDSDEHHFVPPPPTTPFFVPDQDFFANSTLTPVLTCWSGSTGQWRIYFGFVNDFGATKNIPRGDDNNFLVDSRVFEDEKIPTSFLTGKHLNVFRVKSERPTVDVKWELDGNIVSLSLPVPNTNLGLSTWITHQCTGAVTAKFDFFVPCNVTSTAIKKKISENAVSIFGEKISKYGWTPENFSFFAEPDLNVILGCTQKQENQKIHVEVKISVVGENGAYSAFDVAFESIVEEQSRGWFEGIPISEFSKISSSFTSEAIPLVGSKDPSKDQSVVEIPWASTKQHIAILVLFGIVVGVVLSLVIFFTVKGKAETCLDF